MMVPHQMLQPQPTRQKSTVKSCPTPTMMSKQNVPSRSSGRSSDENLGRPKHKQNAPLKIVPVYKSVSFFGAGMQISHLSLGRCSSKLDKSTRGKLEGLGLLFELSSWPPAAKDPNVFLSAAKNHFYMALQFFTVNSNFALLINK